MEKIFGSVYRKQHLSVNWLDYFQRRSKEEQLGEVRRI